MLEARRPVGRLFYLALALVMAASGSRLASPDASAGNPKKPATSSEAEPRASEPTPAAGSPSPQSGPTLTSVIDRIYRADGSPGQDVLIVTWPAFTTAAGSPVAAGALDVTLGTRVALSVALAANAGANPRGVYHTVVYQLGPGEVRTEYRMVPTSSPAALAQVRTTPGAGTAGQPVSEPYVNSVLAAKANDSAVVPLAGTETVRGEVFFLSHRMYRLR
jgi:hypothetical protein